MFPASLTFNWAAGLRFRLVLLVLIALLPVFGLFAYTAAQSQASALESARASLQSEALIAAARQQQLVERVKQLLSDIASGPSIKDTSLNLCQPYLRNLKSQDSNYANLGLIGLDGVVSCLAMEAGVNGPFQLGDRAYFKRALATKKFSVGDYAVGVVSGLPSLAFATPVYGVGGVFNGVAFASVDVRAIDQVLAETRLMTGAQLRVLDQRGVVLAAYPASAGVLGAQERDAIVREAVQTRQPGTRDATDNAGIERFYAFAPVEGTNGGMFVTVSVPLAAITAGPTQELLFDLLALLLLTLVGVGTAWWLGGSLIVQPAKAVLEQAGEITLGNLAARVDLGTLKRGEFGEIGAAFNRMADSLRARNQEIESALNALHQERNTRDLIINSMSEGVVAADQHGRCLFFNTPFSKMFPGIELGASLENMHPQQLVMTLDGTRIYSMAERPMAQTLRGLNVDNWDALLRNPGSEERALRVNARPLRDAKNHLTGGVAVLSDITELNATERFVHGQQTVLALIAGGAALLPCLEAIVRLIEHRVSGSMCSVLLVRDHRLYHGASISLPQSFLDQIDGLAVGDGVGACGTAAFLKRPVLVENVGTDPLMQDFRTLMQTYDLQACWSVPVLAIDNEVIATFAIYHHKHCAPQPSDLEILDTAARLAGIALERDRSKAALVSSEARFRELAENIGDAFYNRDAHTGQILYVSPGYEKIWGRSCESLYAAPDSYLDVVLAEDGPLQLKTRKQQNKNQKSDEQYRILNAQGQVRWIHDISYPVFDAGGRLERIVGTAQDITDRKLTELALASTNRALQMLSLSNVALTRMDDEAALLAEVCRVAVDSGNYRMAWVGYAQEDLAHSIRPVAHAGHEAGYLSSIKLSWSADHPIGQGPAGQVIRSGRPQCSGDIARAENSFHWHELAQEKGYRSAVFLPLRDEQRTFGVLGLYAGDVQNFPAEEVKLLQELADNLAFGIGSLRARLERLRSLEAAREAATKVREQASLLDRAPDAIMVRNLDRTIRYWNKGAEHLYGWTSAEVLGQTMDDLMYRSPQVLATAMNQTLARGGDWTSELEQVARDGSTVYVETHWTVVRDEHGEVNGVLGIDTDIRERRRAREEILNLNASLEERVNQRTAQLQFANKQLEAFSYSLSHDLRTPLSAVDGFGHLLEKALMTSSDAPSPERIKHYLARIRAGVVQMGKLIDVMLSLAQVSRKSLHWEPVDLSAQAEALLRGYQEREPDRATLLHVEPGLKAQGDPRLLRQMLDNLLGNAWKFSARQTRTDITFGRETGTSEEVYFVRDNGAGFDMAYANKLFGAFERLHSPSEFAGTGIGLTTVHRIVLRHGGRVWGQSAPGLGATFYFTLDATRPST